MELVTCNEATLDCNTSQLSSASCSFLSLIDGQQTVFLHHLTRLKQMFANYISLLVFPLLSFQENDATKKAPVNWPPTHSSKLFKFKED